MGVIKMFDSSEQRLKDICTTFLLSENILASAGSCIDRIKTNAPFYENFEVTLETLFDVEFHRTRFYIKDVFRYGDLINEAGSSNDDIDIGLIMVRLFISF